MEITLRHATLDDVGLLARLNRQMIEDERSRNPMSLAQLEGRMRGWLLGEWRAVLIACDGQAAGYCLYQARRDSYFPERPVVYVRHYMIERAHRRRGLGRAAFERLVAEWFERGATVELDVLTSNPAGQVFWASLGFQPYATTLKRDPPPAG
ncbi:MAG: GNAT family N-acetyltransferase [Chloroflexota bacterium]